MGLKSKFMEPSYTYVNPYTRGGNGKKYCAMTHGSMFVNMVCKNIFFLIFKLKDQLCA